MIQIFIVVIILFFNIPTHAREKWYIEGSQETAIQGFLENLNSDEAADYGENSSEIGRAAGDLNGDGAPEVALVWVTMGPTYWRNTLTIFTPGGSGEYTVIDSNSTLPLTGEAAAPAIKDGLVTIEQKIYAAGDPICCPTVPKTMKYKWADKKLSEAR
ncbi:MAG: hypothetical protein IT558_05110 [Alphaproteobacteria bacterium]|nr:hypothetical protein [Alphaproteobacteria bacterium]